MARTVRVDIDGCAPLSDELLQALHAACDEVEDGGSPAVLRLFIRGGEPRTAWPGDVGVNEIHRWEKALRRLDLLDGVSVAVVSQACGAGAMELLMAADHRIADRTFSLEQLCAAGAGWPGMALHRVANRTGKERFSIPTFFNFDYDTPVACLPQFQSADRPPLHAPTRSGDWLVSRFQAVQGYKTPEELAAS